MDDFQERLGNLSASDRVLLERKLMKAVDRPRQAPTIRPKLRSDRTTALSFAQQRLWFLDQLLAESPVYNISTAFRLSGLLDIRCLERSLNAVIGRHEVLRTTIGSAEGKPCQIVQDNLPFELVTHDLRVWPEVDREAEASRLLAQDAKRPFNLACDLMIRAMLIRLTEDEHILLMVMHHIASDGWSMGILMRELSHFYEAEISGRPSSLPELPIQYADYAEWQLDWLQGEVLNKQLDYWKQQLAGVPTCLNLPTDRPRPAVQTFRGASRHLEFSPELTQALKALSLREKTSLFMTLLAAFQVILFRYTGQDDIVLGSPIAGRNRGEVEELIGFFVNTLALRTDLSGDPTFLELLRRVREVALEAYDHQDLPFERLVEDLHSERSLSQNPLFQVMFILQNAPSSPLKLSGLVASPMRVATETAHFDLTMSITERRPGLIARLSYSTDLFEEPTIERMLGHFEVLLEGIVKRPDERISQLPWLKEAERRQLQEWSQTGGTRNSRGWDLPALFEAQADQTPEVVALEFEREGLTYAELNRRANQLAHWLKKLGVGPDVLVGLYMERSLETMVAVLGVLKAGGASVPLDTAYPQDRLAFMLADANPRVVITQQRLRNRIPDQDWSVICLDSESKSISKQSSENQTPEALPESLAYVIYTSGSTGRPKGVAMTRQALVNLVTWQCGLSNSKEVSRTLQFTSLSFDVSFQEIFSTWCGGGSLVLVNEDIRKDSLALLRFLHEKRITRLFLPFIALEHLAEAAASCDLLPSTLREVYAAGEQLIVTPNIVGLFGKLPGCSLHNHYGPSESHVVTAYTLPALTSQWPPRPPIGSSIANCQVYVLDRQLTPVPVGVAGELFIGGDCLARGYLNRPELTAERFLPNSFSEEAGGRLYRTGDLVRWLPEGSIEFIGRLDNQIKVRGFRVELGEIEFMLARHPGVRDVVVVVREDVPGHQRLVAYIVRQREGSCEGGELRGFLRAQLPEYMLPSAYVFLESLPLTSSGKVDRRALPVVSGEGGPSEGYLGPRDEVETALVGIWEELLNARPVGVRDNFFELGGHSLLATRLVARVEKSLGAKVALASLFQSPTIESLAQNLREEEQAKQASLMPLRIEGSQQPQAPSIQPRRKADQPAPLSFAQQRLWFIDRLLPGSSLYNVPMAVRLRGALDIECLRRSLETVVGRHEVLRTTIGDSNGEPFQVIAPDWSLELAVHDLTTEPEPLREKKASDRLAEEAFRPFDLARDLMLRAMLIKLAEEEHVLLLVMHHIASDGWSLSVLRRELSHYYQSYQTGKAESLEALPIQYADYAVWQREWLQGEVLEKQLSYWKQNLSGAPRVLELPTDRPRPAIQRFQGATERMQVSPQLVQRLKLLCRRERATLFMTLLAAFQLLLSRYVSRDDIVVGSPIAGRNRAEADDLIGFFVNTLVLRTDLSGDPTFRELLGRVREVALGAYAHQDVPFERLVDELQAERDLSHHSLVQVMFVLQNAPEGRLVLSGLEVSPFRIRSSQAKFDLTLSVAETAAGMTVALGYNTDLYATASMERMLMHYRVVLENITAHPEHRLSELSLLTKEEWSQLRQWNQTAREYPRDRCIQELFEEQVQRTPQSIALTFGDEQLKYDELNCRANQLAHYLRAIGVGPEVLVGLYLERSVDQIVALLAILKAGGAYLPLDLTYPKQRLTFMLKDAGISVLMTQRRFVTKLPSDRLTLCCLDEIESALSQESTQNPLSGVRKENLVYVIYTSGSTGQPKGIAVTHQAVVRLVVNTDYVQIAPSDVVAQVSNSSFDAATFEIWGALLHGARLVGLPKEVVLSPEAFASSLVQRRISVLFLTTALFNQVSREKPAAFATVRHLLFGGETVEPRCVENVLRDHRPERLLHVYGPTETTTFASWYLVTPPLRKSRTIPIGQPIANTQIYVLDRWLRPVPVGVTGELYVGGDGLARGYLNRPDLTAERFVPNPFSNQAGDRLYRTGDLARWLAEGNIEFIGRLDNQVKIRGHRIELGEIESVIKQQPAVRDAVVVMRQDSEGEKRLVGYVVLQSQGAASSDSIREFLKAKLPDYMIPGSLVILERLPLTDNGKIDHKALLAVAPSNRGAESGYLGPRDEIERELVTIWEELLGAKPIGVTDNFFELGGHSLLATRLVARIEKTLGNASLSNLFQSPTIESLARELRRKKREKEDSALLLFRNGGSRPPLFLLGGSFELSRCLGEDQPCYGIRPHGQDGRRAPTTVEEMAADYLRQIRAVQPQGPYLIGGFSFGGLVAYEMAQQLRQSGQEVGLLVLIEPTPPRFGIPTDFTPAHQPLGSKYLSPSLRHWTNLRQLGGNQRVGYLMGELRWRKQHAVNVLKILLCRAYLCAGRRIPLKLRMSYFFDVSRKAAGRYSPKPYDGRAALLRSQSGGDYSRSAWRELIPNQLEVHELPGQHLDPIQGPSVKIWGRQLAVCLADSDSVCVPATR